MARIDEGTELLMQLIMQSRNFKDLKGVLQWLHRESG